MRSRITQFFTALIFLVGSTLVQAQVIVDTDTTSDVGQGLTFLHVSNTPDMTFATAQSGFAWGGFNWRLATVEEFLALMENVNGVPIATWDGSNPNEVDYTLPQGTAMMEALDGVGGAVELPGVWLDSEAVASGSAQFFAHSPSNNDFHLLDGAGWGSTVPALFVRGGASTTGGSTTAVPTLPEWGMIMLVLLMMGAAATRLYQRS